MAHGQSVYVSNVITIPHMHKILQDFVYKFHESLGTCENKKANFPHCLGQCAQRRCYWVSEAYTQTLLLCEIAQKTIKGYFKTA